MRSMTSLLIPAFLLAGCANGLTGLRPLSYQQPGDTRLFVSYKRCPHATGENVAPIFAAAAMTVVSNLLTSFGTTLSKAAEGGKLPASIAMSNVEFERDRIPRCVIVIRGQFTQRATSQQPLTLVDPLLLVSVENQVQLPLKVRKGPGNYIDIGLPLVYDLQHYVELSIIRSENKSAVAVAPVFTRIARSMDGSTSGSRELAISLQFKRPGEDPVEGAVLIGDRQIGAENTYTMHATTGRYPHESPWFTGVGVPLAAEKGSSGEKTSQPAPSGTGTGGGGGGGTGTGGQAPAQPNTGQTGNGNAANDEAGPFPYTVTATIVETRPTREFLAFAASVFTAVQPTIESEIKGQIDSTQRRTNASGDLETQGAYRSALGAAHSAVVEYCALEGDDKRAERYAKSGSAAKAQLDANKAAIAALVSPLPFSAANLVQVSGDKPSVVNSAACQGHT